MDGARAGSASGPPRGFFGQAFRFGLVGVVGAITDYGSMLGMLGLGLQVDLARAASFVLGSTAAYLLNRRWTFTSRRDTREVLSVAATYGLTFLLIVAVYALTRRVLPESMWRLTAAWVISQGIGTTFNFLTQRMIIFRR